MTGIDAVPSINVADHQKRVEARSQHFCLVGCRVGSKQMALIQVIAVSLNPARVVLGNEQAVKVLLDIDYRTEPVEHRKHWIACTSDVLSVKMVNDSVLEQSQRVFFLQVQVAADVRQDFWGYVCPLISLELLAAHFDAFVLRNSNAHWTKLIGKSFLGPQTPHHTFFQHFSGGNCVVTGV